MNTNEERVVSDVRPVVIEQLPTEQRPGFFHTLGEKIGLVSPTPDATHFAKQPTPDPYPTYVTNNPTTLTGAELTDRINNAEQPSIVEKARDYMYGAGEWIGLVGNRDGVPAEHTAFDQKPVSERAQDKLNEAGHRVSLASENAKEKFYEAGQKVGLIEKPAHEKAQDKLTEAGQRVGLVDKPLSDKAQDKLDDARLRANLAKENVKDTTLNAAEQAKLDDQRSFTEKTKDYLYGIGEKTGIVNSHPDLERAKDNLNLAKDKAFVSGENAGLVREKSYPEMAADKLREVGEKVGLNTLPVPKKFPADFSADFTDMEGQALIDVPPHEVSNKALPA